jgi:group I intron endonuclease
VERNVIVYLITNKVNGKRYIGQTSQSLDERWRCHKKMSSGCLLIKQAIKKYGAENFTTKVIVIADKKNANYYERKLIEIWKTKAPNGYNLTDGGEGVLHPSIETRQRMREAQLGKKQSKETREKISKALKGRVFSEETKRKMSRAQLGNQYSLGRIISKETRRKISKAHLGNKYALGAYRSPEYRKKLSDIQKGKKLTREHKLKLSKAAKKRANTKEGRRHLLLCVHKQQHENRNIINLNCDICKET